MASNEAKRRNPSNKNFFCLNVRDAFSIFRNMARRKVYIRDIWGLYMLLEIHWWTDTPLFLVFLSGMYTSIRILPCRLPCSAPIYMSFTLTLPCTVSLIHFVFFQRSASFAWLSWTSKNIVIPLTIQELTFHEILNKQFGLCPPWETNYRVALTLLVCFKL